MERFSVTFGVLIVVVLVTMNGGYLCDASIEKDSSTQDFYFVQLTDTHVMSTVFEPSGLSMLRLRMALDHICSFEPKPACIVITGDLTNWGGSWVSGALNCHAFVTCFFLSDGQLFADEHHTVPVYTTPGNHDYFFVRNLDNYHRLIRNESRYIINCSVMSLLFISSGPAMFGGGAGLYDDDMAWLDHALDACNASVKIVLMHHPAVNQRGNHGVMEAVLARNREAFVTTCEAHQVELVLTGHTHRSRVYEGDEHLVNDTVALNCSIYPTLFVQTDDTSDNINYRNVTVSGRTVWLGSTVRIPVNDSE